MKTFRAKPIWTGTPDPLVAGQWTPAPHWATHILKNQHGSYAWAEQFGELYLGEPRYRSDVQSRDVFTIGPAAWQVVEARPGTEQPSADQIKSLELSLRDALKELRLMRETQASDKRLIESLMAERCQQPAPPPGFDSVMEAVRHYGETCAEDGSASLWGGMTARSGVEAALRAALAATKASGSKDQP